MKMTTISPLCVGITVPAAASYPATDIEGHSMVEIPGGLSVIGAGAATDELADNPARWVQLSPYLIAEAATTAMQYEWMTRGESPPVSHQGHPAMGVSYHDAVDYLRLCSPRLRLPTDAEWENAARGPARDMREAMEAEAGRFDPKEFVEFAEGRYENFVFGIMGQIITNPRTPLFQHLIREGLPFFGWSVYATPSGRLSKEDVWYGRRRTAPVSWGSKNGYGLYGMSGGIAEWTKNLLGHEVCFAGEIDPQGPLRSHIFIKDHSAVRGGSYMTGRRAKLRLAHRDFELRQKRLNTVGFRVAASLGDGT